MACMTTSSAGTPPPCLASFPSCSCGHVFAAHFCTAPRLPCAVASLAAISHAEADLWLARADQGLVEMNFFITIQPSSLGITVADVSAAGFINSLRLMYHVSFMFLGCAALQARCCWRRSAAGQQARSFHARARARAARAVATRELAWCFSPVPRAM